MTDRFGNEIQPGDIVRVRSVDYVWDDHGNPSKCWKYTEGKVLHMTDKSVQYRYIKRIENQRYWGIPPEIESHEASVSPQKLISLSALKRKGVPVDRYITIHEGLLW